jgi:hypothetical protein
MGRLSRYRAVPTSAIKRRRRLRRLIHRNHPELEDLIEEDGGELEICVCGEKQ